MRRSAIAGIAVAAGLACRGLRRWRTIALIVVGGVVIPAGLARAEPAADYTVTPITQTGVTVRQAEAINNNGDVVGLAEFPDAGTNLCGFLWHAGTLTELAGTYTQSGASAGCGGAAGAGATEAWDLNDSDLVAGDADFGYQDTSTNPPSTSDAEQAADWPGLNPAADLGSNCSSAAGPGASQALAVNNTGTYGGDAFTSCGGTSGNSVTSAWLGSPSTIIAPGTPQTGGKGDAYTIAVNANGQALVYYDGAGTGTGASKAPVSAALYSNGALQPLPIQVALIANGSSARGGPGALNDSGVVVGSTSSHQPAFSQNAGIAVVLTPADGDSEGIGEGVNDLGSVVGASLSGAGTTVATLWPQAAPPAFPTTEPAGIDLNTLIPASAGITLTSAVAINQAGQILAAGTLSGGASEWVVLSPLIVTSTGDQPEAASAAPGVCDDGSGQCTLRAAIQVADASGNPETIAFDIPGDGVPRISPSSPLPALTNPGTTIDGTTQPNTPTGQPGVQLDGSGAGGAADGLQIEAANVTVKGLMLTGFGGDAISIPPAGSSATVQTSWIGVGPGGTIARNMTGIEVQAAGATIGGASAGDGDVISGNGNVSALQSDESDLTPDSPSSIKTDLTAVGGGIVADPTAPVSNLQILGDLIGPEPTGNDAGSYSNSVGVLLSGGLTGVTVGGAGLSADVVTDDVVGLSALGSGVSGLSVAGDQFGTLSGSSTSDTGDGIGLYAGQSVSGMSLGAPGDGDTFEHDGVGAVMAGLNSPTVQGDTFGPDEAVPGDSRTNLVGLALLDSTGATVGGSGGAGNQFTGDQIGLLVAGSNSSANTITGNTIGRAHDLGIAPTGLATAGEGSTFGLLIDGGSGNVVSNNQILYAGLGIGIGASSDNTVTGNTVIGNYFGVWAINGADNQIGAPSAGNTIERNDVGIIVLDQNLPPAEQTDAGLPSNSDAVQSTRDQALDVSSDSDDLDLATAASTASVGSSAVNVPSGVGSGDAIQGNTVGGSGQGNNVGVVLGGDLSGTIVGGLSGGDANAISHDHEAGLWIIGAAGHEPTVAVLSNQIFDNFDDSIAGDVPGLGIDLASLDASGNPLPADGFGANSPYHSIQPDPSGPNGLQNAPVLTAAVASSAGVQVTGTLTTAPKSSYLVQVFASTACNASGYGEGQQLIGSGTVTTGSSGVGAISGTLPDSLTGAKVITATATSLSGSTPVATSEFSNCETIGSAASSFTGATGSGATGSVSGGTTSVSVICPVDATAACVGEVELTSTVECASSAAAAGLCQSSGQDLARDARATKKAKRVTVVLGRARFSVVRGHHKSVHIHLSKLAQRLLAKDHSLNARLTITSRSGKSPERTHTQKLVLRPVKATKKKSA